MLKTGESGNLEWTKMRWGLTGLQSTGGTPVTNIRNIKSSHWRPLLRTQHALVNWEDAAAAWLVRQRREIWRTGDPRLEALVARAERLIGPLPSAERVEGLPMFCARMKAGEEILELFTAVVRFDAASDVTLSELRIELMYPGNDAADRLFRYQADTVQDDESDARRAVR